MAFLDEGTPRWDTFQQGGSGDTVVNSLTDDYLLVKGSKNTTDKYEVAALTSAATDVIRGVTAGADDFNSTDIYTNSKFGIVRIKTGQKLRARTATAYVASDYGKRVAADATANQRGWVTVVSTGGVGRVVGGETINSIHYIDFWLDESS